MCAHLQSNPLVPHEGYVPIKNAALFYREVGHGQPIIVLHGGPDFDHTYLLPDMDRLSDSYRLIYYDQRGRGKSVGEIDPADVSLETEIEDLEALREHLQLKTVVVLGHSFGAILAMEYAIRHPQRVSHLILMNTAAASQEDYQMLRQEVLRRRAVHQAELDGIISSAAYQEGNPDAVAAYYRLHFGTTIKQPQHLESLIAQMRLSFTKEIVLQSRAVEQQLYKQTWYSSDYNLFPGLKRLSIPTLVIHGDYDFIPVECAMHIAEAVPDARLVVLKDCGHFAYLESPDAIRVGLNNFLRENP